MSFKYSNELVLSINAGCPGAGRGLYSADIRRRDFAEVYQFSV
jgi:hypothetical protein